MKTQPRISEDDDHRVIKFRPRGTAGLARGEAGTALPPDDLARYEGGRDEPDDFRHRMLANVAAGAFTVALTGIGIWLAASIADVRRTQDCVLMGRPDCARIASPSG